MGKRPSFTKVLLGDFSDRLRIPPAFTKFIHKEAPRKAILKGPSGCQWSVTVSVCGNGSDRPSYYFKAGWETFVKDHRLQEHDFLVFKYGGGMRFSVLVFDKTACEREDAFRVKNSTIDEARRKLSSRQGAENIPKDKKRTRVQYETGNSVSAAAARNVDKKINKGKSDDQPTRTRKSNRLKSDPETFSSRFPFFIKCLPPISVKGAGSVMHVPSNFHGRLQRGQMVLQARRGQKCPVSVKRSGRRMIISRGWITFCRVNDLKVGDTCIFELRDPSTLWVHVYPAL